MVTTLPPTVLTDLAHGGRWTSLRAGEREWLWHRPDRARATVRPGDPFVDAGGLEECVPTVRGTPDHGDAWSRPWRRDGDTDLVQCPDFVLRRRIETGPTALRAVYELHADPGYRLLWAAHALLDTTPHARLTAPDATTARLFPEAAGLLDRPWPEGARHITGPWPTPHGLPLDRLGPDDGTAVGAILTDCASVTVTDGPHTLTFSLHTDAAVPVSVALWRNLRGFPASAPYRSIGVEPMLGSVFDLAEAGPDDAATVPAGGTLRWELGITATGTRST
ncbi:hypothetical protein P3T37_003091 [Kitasatospora sp. MAA4]|uniref:hypothetical protein n=1 Tax=Kitasatospora sp. MAA4 TaxID=3035093 RepID=UPI0024737D9A|nr:hypothetical protein [Kitasatospora sp. MAA4]MDH6133693.1 hypothetical protein [Kitasatospora sp. MAA4]